MSTTHRALTTARRPQESTGRKPVFIARAKVGPRDGNWAVIGAVWPRKGENAEGYVLKLHTLPIGPEWNGLVVLKPPRSPDEGDEFPQPDE